MKTANIKKLTDSLIDNEAYDSLDVFISILKDERVEPSDGVTEDAIHTKAYRVAELIGEDVVKFLKLEGVFDDYVNEFDFDYWGPNLNGLNDPIMEAFHWGESDDGFDFWNKTNDNWKLYKRYL